MDRISQAKGGMGVCSMSEKTQWLRRRRCWGITGGSVGLGYKDYRDTGYGQKPDGQVRARSQRTMPSYGTGLGPAGSCELMKDFRDR